MSSKSGHKESQVSKILAAVAVQQLATLQPEQGTKNTLNLKEHPEQPKLLASGSLSTMPTPTWSSTPSFSESSTHPGPGSLPKPVPDTSAKLTFTLSPEELDLAKDLVLDLLGWGVEPEYLIDSGVSAAVIFRVFTDLNLRLPKNLKVSEELKKVAYSWGPSPFELPETSS
ncbi:hypothetical protein BDN70DRAFT_989839 [Pholiota conissans]|uniref:Uncharacterized protein n=1 Tax=Pholiota conissans TaxID=109636 RepID=A0A9P5ZAC7_9AGAR|nr:hypothetical protein BDN70DRAFT_989839 [Pholiota conissans]